MIELLGVVTAVAALILPAYLLFYTLRILPRRRDQIRVLMTKDAAKAYCRVFVPCDPDEPKKPAERAGPDGTPEPPEPSEPQKVAGPEETAEAARKAETERARALEKLVAQRFDAAHSPRDYLWTGAMAWLPSTLGLVLTFLWVRGRLAGTEGPVDGIPTTLVMAFLGGAIWSFYELLERGTRGDLLPHTLVQISYRVLASVPIGYAFSLLVMEEAAVFVAFAASAFPMRDIRLFLRTRMMKQLEQDPAASRTAPREALLGQRVQGISAKNLARLSEVEISTVVDMALADPIQVMVTTGIPLRVLIDWIDQSLLALYVGDKMDALARMGVRGALEASHVYEEHCGEWDAKEKDLWLYYEDAHDDPFVKELAEVLEIEPIYAVHLLAEIDEDPHVGLLSALWGEWEPEASTA